MAWQAGRQHPAHTQTLPELKSLATQPQTGRSGHAASIRQLAAAPTLSVVPPGGPRPPPLPRAPPPSSGRPSMQGKVCGKPSPANPHLTQPVPLSQTCGGGRQWRLRAWEPGHRRQRLRAGEAASGGPGGGHCCRRCGPCRAAAQPSPRHDVGRRPCETAGQASAHYEGKMSLPN